MIRKSGSLFFAAAVACGSPPSDGHDQGHPDPPSDPPPRASGDATGTTGAFPGGTTSGEGPKAEPAHRLAASDRKGIRWVYTPRVNDGRKYFRSPLRYTDGRLRVAIGAPDSRARFPAMQISAENEPSSHAWGFVDKAGKVVVPAIYGDAHAFSEGLAAVGTLIGRNLPAQRWGVIDVDGNVVIPLKFRWIGMFSEGLASFRKNGKFGYIDQVGKVVIQARYTFAGHFHNGHAVVTTDRKKKKLFAIDTSGKRTTVPVPWNYLKPTDYPQWDPPPLQIPYTNGHGFSYQGSVDRSLLGGTAFDLALPFSEGLGPVDTKQGDGECEYVDEWLRPQFAIPCDYPVPIHDGRIVMVYGDGAKWAVYDAKGKLVFDELPEFEMDQTPGPLSPQMRRHLKYDRP